MRRSTSRSASRRPKSRSKKEAEEEGFTQAGGRVPFGVTDFLVASDGKAYPEKVPTAATTHIRTDVAPGLATNPFAVERCSLDGFRRWSTARRRSRRQGSFAAPDAECEASEIGEQQATIYTGKLGEGAGDVPVEGLVYDLEPSEGETMRPGGPHLAALYGVAVELPKFLTEPELKAHFEAEPLPEGPGGPAEKKATEEFLIKHQWYSHSLIKGNVEWGKEAIGTG